MASYWIRQNGHGAQGPFEESRVARYIQQGKVRAGAGMEISPDGQRWIPVEEHRLFASAPRPAQPVQAVVEVEDVPAIASARRPDRDRRRPLARPGRSSGGGGQVVAVILGLLVVGGIAVVASKGGSKDADPSGSASSQPIASATPVVVSPKSPPPVVETKAEYRARWTRHRKTYWGNGTELNEGVLGGYRDEEIESKVTEISGRKPERTQTIGGRRFWYFPCSDGLIQLIWWKNDLGMYHYEINDY